MPFVTQSRLESKHGVVQRTGLSCFLCPRPPLTVEAAALKCLEGWPGQLYKHLLSSQHLPCPGLECRDERWAFLCPLEAHCLVMEGTGTPMGHAGVAALRCATLSSLQRTCCRMQLADCPQLASPPPPPTPCLLLGSTAALTWRPPPPWAPGQWLSPVGSQSFCCG